MLLGYLVFRGIKNDLALLEKNRGEELQSLSDEIIRNLDKDLSAAEKDFQKFFSEYNVNNPTDKIRQLQELKAAQPMIEEVFSIQDEQTIHFMGAFLLYQAKERIKIPDDYVPDRSIDHLILQGQQSEFQRRGYERALFFYRQALSRVSNLIAQGDLMNKIARVQKKGGLFLEAENTYHIIADKYGQIPLRPGMPLGLAARIEIGSLGLESKDFTRALEVYMELFLDLIEGEWILEKEAYIFYATRIKDSINSILSQQNFSENEQSHKEDLYKLIDEEKIKKERTERLLVFQENALEERELMILKSKENIPEGNTRFILDISPNIYLVCLLLKKRTEDKIWGFLVDEQQLQNIFKQMILHIELPKGSDWILRGRDRNVLLSSSDSPSEPPAVKSDFIGNFPDWTLEFFQKDPRLLDAFLTSRRGIYFYMFILITGILFFGLILTLRTFSREMELSRIKSDFVSTVSHEFKSPLTSIRQIAEMLRSGTI